MVEQVEKKAEKQVAEGRSEVIAREMKEVRQVVLK